MEFFVRLLQLVFKTIHAIIYPFLVLLLPRRTANIVTPNNNRLITLALVDVIKELQQRKITSTQLVDAYIQRVRQVNPVLNAVVEERFAEAYQEAQEADELIAKTPADQITALFTEFPLLGVPFTVKESCGLKDMSFAVGSLQRVGVKSAEDGEAVARVRAAGAIPLLVSANPEYCFSIETNTYTNGKCANPYDLRRTSGGSSGGEGALNGAGASLFGIGSDVAGSIRIPALFNGVFGHKPTGGLVSVKGLFPYSTDRIYDTYLQVGPITRFARDLRLLTHVLAGTDASRIHIALPRDLSSVKIFYSTGFTGVNGFLHSSVSNDIQLAVIRAVDYFKESGLKTAPIQMQRFHNSTEIALSALVRVQDFPNLITCNSRLKVFEVLKQYVKSIFGKSLFTRDGLLFEVMLTTNAFMPRRNLEKYKGELEQLKAEIIHLLGDEGVLLFPTFHMSAIHHHTSHLPVWGIDYALIFNVLGLPATHVPMGLNDSKLPIGFQVVAAPYKDELCFKIACELEIAFGGWVPPKMSY